MTSSSDPLTEGANGNGHAGRYYGQGIPYLSLDSYPGKLIAIEGTDGVGRSTQIQLLREWLEIKGYGVIETGWTRSELMQPTIELAKSSNTLNKLTFVLLYATDFADRLEKEIIPALKAGFIVLSDRYIFTALARAGVRGVDRQWLRNLYGFGIAPHLVFYLRIDEKTLIRRVLQSRVLMALGLISYGIYLWHWPVLVLAAARFGPLTVVERVGTLALVVGLAALSYRFIENPARRSVWLGARPRRSLAFGGALGFTGAGLAIAMLVMSPSLTGGSDAAAPALVLPSTTTVATPQLPAAIAPPGLVPSAPTTITPTELTPTTISPTTITPTTAQPSSAEMIASIVAANAATLQQAAITDSLPANLTPSLGSARSDKPVIYADGCILSNGKVSAKDCVYGDTASAHTIVLFGDSHAAQWFPALQEMSLRNHWRLDVLTKKGCPTADIPIADPARGPECGPWRKLVLARLAEEHPDLVIMSAYRYSTTSAVIGSSPDEVWRNGMQTTLDHVRPLAGNVLVLGDTPTPLSDVPGCVASHPRHVTACMNHRSAAIKPGRLSVELDVATAHDAWFVPTGDWLCSTSDCPVVIGNLLVYRDNSHITTAASRWLEPYLEAAVKPILDHPNGA